MTQSRLLGGGFAGAALLLLLSLIVTAGPSRRPETREVEQAAAAKPRAQRPPIPMPLNLAGLDITLGLKDQKPTPWRGSIDVSEGRVLAVEVVHNDPQSKIDGNRFETRSVRRMMMMQETIAPAVVRVNLDASSSANVTISTGQGAFKFGLSDLVSGKAKEFLDGQVSVERQDGAVRLTSPETEDDFPALAKGKDGMIWLAYVEYQPGNPIVTERVSAGGFESLETKGNGDRICLMRFDGKMWSPAIDVTDGGLDVWRPTVAVDGKGRVVVAWSQQVDGDWEIFYRRYTPAATAATPGQWSDIVRLTRTPGADFHVVATTDANGIVWLAWQAWRKDNFDILLAALDANHPWSKPRAISNSKANDWSPAIAADSKGNVYVAWDTYDRGNYDVRLQRIGKEIQTWTIAGSAKFEARASIVCDTKDRVWIAYESGDEQWGKDYSTNQFKRIGFQKNPGSALYINRTVQVKCLVDGKLMQPVTSPEAFRNQLARNKSLPRLATDASGGVWLLIRHHPLPNGAGEVWNSYALRYDGKTWGPAQRLPASANLLDNRPAFVPLEQGILVVYSGDGRIRTANRDQNDLFATVLRPSGPTQPLELIAAEPSPEPAVAEVHAHEAEDLARMRNYRVDQGGKKLHLWRGEFHRHTEISAHQDQDGLLEDAYRYGLDAGGLDWIGVGDHDNGFGSEYMWWLMQKNTDLYQHAPHFVSVHTYERSVVYPNGHRNVIMPRRGIRPLPRGNLKGTPQDGTPDTKMLYAYLKHFGGMCASHTSATNMGTDWRDNSGEFEPVVEIYQGHRHNYEHFGAPRAPTKDTNIGGYEPAGFVWNALEKGYRLGFQCSSDHVSTHLSYAVLLTGDLSRQGVIDAFKKRHSYGATDNIVLDVRCGEHLMGDEFEMTKPPTLDIVAVGTGPIAKVHVIRDNKYVYTTEPNQREVKLRYSDMDPKSGKTSYYYVRVEQADGSLAWASPMWITYRP